MDKKGAEADEATLESTEYTVRSSDSDSDGSNRESSLGVSLGFLQRRGGKGSRREEEMRSIAVGMVAWMRTAGTAQQNDRRSCAQRDGPAVRSRRREGFDPAVRTKGPNGRRVQRLRDQTDSELEQQCRLGS